MIVREWAHQLVLKRRAQSAHVFTLTGNVSDLVARAVDGSDYYNLSEALLRLFGRHAFVFEYDFARGFRFANEESEKRFRTFSKQNGVHPPPEDEELDGQGAAGEGGQPGQGGIQGQQNPRRPTGAEAVLDVDNIRVQIPDQVRDRRIIANLPVEFRNSYITLPEEEKKRLRRLRDHEILEYLMMKQHQVTTPDAVKEDEDGRVELPQRIDQVFAFIREVFAIDMEEITGRLDEAKDGQITAPAAVIIYGAEFIFTGGADHRLSDVEQFVLGTLVGIAGNQQIGQEGSVLILAAKNEASLPDALIDPAYGFCKIDIPYPDQGQREHFLSVLPKRIDLAVPGLRLADEKERGEVYVLPQDMTAESFSRGPTAGMRLLDIESVARDIAATPPEKGQELNPPVLSVEAMWAQKKAYLESASRGRIQAVKPAILFDWIGGHGEIKQYLIAVARSVLKGDIARTPKGLLLIGPPGTGKSVLAEATAQLSGSSMVSIKNQKSMWLGQSTKHVAADNNLLLAFEPVIVRQDEAKGKQYNRNAQYQGDGGVSMEMGSIQLEFLGDDSRRGKVIWFALSNRPDLFDDAMIRPGRFDRIVPILPPTSPEDWARVAKAISRKMSAQYGQFKWQVSDDDLLELVFNLPPESTQAHLNEFCYRAYYFSQDGAIGASELRRGIKDYRPRKNREFARQLELSLEFANSEELVPAAYRGHKLASRQRPSQDAAYDASPIVFADRNADEPPPDKKPPR